MQPAGFSTPKLPYNCCWPNRRTEADDFAMAINKHNNSRREFDSSITEQALDMIRENEALTHAKSTVLFDASWHKGRNRYCGVALY